MSFLAVTRSLISMTNPTEAEFDTMRTGLLNYFNAGSMTEANVAAGGMVYTSLGVAVDDVGMNWTAAVAYIIFVSATPTFKIDNTLGDIVFENTLISEVESLRISSTGTLTIGTGGNLQLNTSVGSQAVSTSWLLARYRKPKLDYVDANIVTVSTNSPNASETIILMRDRLCTVIDTTMSLSVAANGYASGDTGAAVSGLQNDLTRTANRWYYVYAVQVQFGTDNDGTKAILVATTTSPVQANAATLDTEFGSAKWVYLGVIRNGYNDGVTTNSILPFSYDGYGNLRFTTTTETGQGQGLRLASSSSSSDLEYTLTFGVGASDLPVVATRGVFTGFRSADAFPMNYMNIASGDIYAQTTCLADSDTTNVIAAIHLDVPFIDGFKVRVVVGASSTTNKIRLASLVDHYA